ncbi:hypothetical protein NRB56_26720 [Nocardia sp. RB56]|uniref:Uncharacterized protein n=1 Tax=Nocardia aurantia TaxID=2585199 RepID=A0A7K0DMW3_9NOCA|nr:hypothetical protein [Nocardia aurantia]
MVTPTEAIAVSVDALIDALDEFTIGLRPTRAPPSATRA